MARGGFHQGIHSESWQSRGVKTSVDHQSNLVLVAGEDFPAVPVQQNEVERWDADGVQQEHHSRVDTHVVISG